MKGGRSTDVVVEVVAVSVVVVVAAALCADSYFGIRSTPVLPQ